MSQESLNAESSLEEQLVAYLDGELDSQSCRRIEELLAVDPEVRRKLHWLERTWEMLDELDTAPVGEDFTRTTLEMVAVAAEKDVRKIQEQAPRRRRRMWLVLGGGLLLAALAGFACYFPDRRQCEPAVDPRPAPAGKSRRIPANQGHTIPPHAAGKRTFH